MVNDMRKERLVHGVLERQAEKYGDRTFIYFKERTFSYREFDEQAGRVACGLQRMGISKGDKVAIMMPNCPEFLFLWFGLSKLGAVEVPINLAHKGDLLTYMLDQSDCCLIVAHGDYRDRLKAIEVNIPKIRQIVILDPPGASASPLLTKPVVPWSDVVNNGGDYIREEVLWSDPSCILYTSGTTGPSKGVMLPQNYTVFMGEIIWEAAEYTEDDCLYNALPLFHGNAQQLSFMPALLSGARTVISERFSASRFWGDVKRYGCTEFNSLGSIVPILYKADPKPDDADNPLRLMVCAATPKDLFHAFEERFGLKLVEIYGMTEFGLPLMNNIRDRKAGTCGKPRRCAVKLLDDNDMPVGPNAVGELLVRPDGDYCMLLEYYNMPDKTVEAWRNLWFHSGDYFTYDDEGYYSFVDRKKDALRRRGENISSYEVEKSINAHAAVMESAAMAVKSPMGEDEVMVCLVLKPGFRLTPEELMAHCEERMAYFMIPRYLRFMEAFPKTATERVQKHVLRTEGVTDDTWDREAAGYELKR